MLPMGVHDEFMKLEDVYPLPKFFGFIYIVLLYYSFYRQFSSGVRPALLMGVAPEATAECLHLGVGSTFAIFIPIFFIFYFILTGI